MHKVDCVKITHFKNGYANLCGQLIGACRVPVSNKDMSEFAPFNRADLKFHNGVYVLSTPDRYHVGHIYDRTYNEARAVKPNFEPREWSPGDEFTRKPRGKNLARRQRR